MNAVELNYKEYGTGNKHLIILHGFLGSLDNWHTLANELANHGLHVWAVDQRNHGKSPHTSSHSIPLMVADLKLFIDTFCKGKAILLGHSMGGKTVMQFALNYPQQTEKLIVADIAPKPYRNGAHDEVFKAINHVNLSTATTRKEIDQAMATYLGDFGTRQFVLKGLDRDDSGIYKWKFNIDVLKRDYINILNEITSPQNYSGPCLFLRGAQSLYIQEKDFALMHKLFPHHQLVTIEGAGHWLHADKPQLVLNEVLNFVA